MSALLDAFNRGREDAIKDRPRLFRSTHARGFVSDVDVDDEYWTEEMCAEYHRGYEAAS